MAESRPRHGHGEDSIYYDEANHCWVAAVSLGYKGGKRVRRKVTGRTKTEVRTKLRDLDHGARSSATYTVGDALAARLSTRSLQITRLCLERAIRHAEVRDLVGRNVAALIKAPAGRAGRPSKSLSLEQAQYLLQAAASSWLYAYVVLSVTTGLRPRSYGRFGGARLTSKLALLRSIAPSGPRRIPRRREAVASCHCRG